ncbi:MAG: S1 RNA-binding domain-containing protein [Candidatus Cloacimonadaceae bacterium]
MLNHDQNPVDSEIEIEGADTASKSTEVETVLEKKEEPNYEEQTSEIEVDETPEEAVAEIQEEDLVQEAQEEPMAIAEAGSENSVPELTEVEEPALEAQEEPKIADTQEPQAEVPEAEAVVEEAETAVEEAETAVEEPQPETPEEPQAELTPEEPQAELTPEEQEHKNMLNMYEESFSNFKVGEIINGTIVDISDKEVRVDIGFKSEGVIQISEFAYSGPPEKNSIIRVFINKIESGDGRLQLSKKKADYQENIERIKKAFEEGSVLTGVIRRRVKGGMIVEVYGIEAFLPGSQMSQTHPEPGPIHR